MKIKLGGDHVANVDSTEDVDLDKDRVVVDGQRLSESRARELAEKIIAHHARRRAGRPSLGSGHSPQVAFRIPVEMKTRLTEVAKREGLRESEVLREALDEYLTDH